MAQRVVIGLSGGVDSSVAAYLLKQAGYDVVALFMKNWHDESVILDSECPWVEDSNDALMVAEQLKIPFHTIDLSQPYKERIIDYMFREYQNGRTPNPDVLCNREIKFDLFLKAAMNLQADFIATGHYCKSEQIIVNDRKIYRLLAGKDKNKDQSYFLCQLNQYQISKVLFPIGDLDKSEVRKIARSISLVTADKKDSQGLCFVGKISLPTFLQQQLEPREGDIIEILTDSPIYQRNLVAAGYNETGFIDPAAMSENYSYEPVSGKVIGRHQGAHYYTIGQRKGLNVGGTKEPLFIIATDTKNNIIYVGQGENHPGLYRQGLSILAQDVHWVRPDKALPEGGQMEVMARIRYRQPLEKGTLYFRGEKLYLIFERAQRGITPGQFAVWYQDDELLGSGVIH